MPFADTQAMNEHLAEIAKTVVPGAHAVIVLDGAGWHGSKALCTPDNITLLPLPPYAPELNPIENVWAYLRANKLAISIFDSYDHIVEKCCDAWNFFAEDKETVQNINLTRIRKKTSFYKAVGIKLYAEHLVWPLFNQLRISGHVGISGTRKYHRHRPAKDR